MEGFLNKIFKRISPASKPSAVALSITPIALILTAGLLSISSLSQQKEFTAKEIQGTYDIEYLIDLRGLLKEIRGMRQFPKHFGTHSVLSATHSNEDAPHRSRAKIHSRTKSHQHKDTVTNLLNTMRNEIAKKLSRKEWLDIKKRYGFHMGDIKLDLVRSSNDANPTEDFNLYTERLDSLNEYFSLVADKSNLILDPEIDTYYLMSLSSTSIPEIVDIIAEVRDLRVLYLQNIDSSNKKSIKKRLKTLSSLLDYQLNNLNRIINILSFSSPNSYKALAIDRIELVEKVDNFRSQIELIKQTDPENTLQLWSQAIELNDFLESIQSNGLKLLRIKLEQRNQNFTSRMISIFGLFMAAAVVVYIFNKYMLGNLSRTLAINEELANTDQLTKLLTRRSLNTLYQQNCYLSKKNHQGLGVCILDIDFFKMFNDSYGHLQGDDALVQVANSLKNTLLRDTDHLFRYGGEEFVILTLTDSEAKLDELMNSVRHTIENLKIENNASLISQYLTISLGGVFIPRNYMQVDFQVVLKIADNALYSIKQKSRNAVSILTITQPLENKAKTTLSKDKRSF